MDNPLDPSEGRHPALIVRPVWRPECLPAERVQATGPALVPAWICRFTYDGERRLVALEERSAATAAAYRRAAYEYGADGALRAVVVEARAEADQPWDPQYIRYHYDDDGFLAARSTASAATGPASATVRYERDGAGRRVGERLCGASGEVVHEDRYGFDDRGRLVEQVHRVGARDQWSIAFEYGEGGRLVRERHGRDGVTTYDYDAGGRLVSRTRRSAGSGAVAHAVRFSYDAAGRLATEDIERPAGPGRARYGYRYD